MYSKTKATQEKLKRYEAVLLDLQKYRRYIGSDFFGNIIISFLPLGKGYGEHPFWLINKLEFIKEIFQRHASESRAR